jgi:hypothetical protein
MNTEKETPMKTRTLAGVATGLAGVLVIGGAQEAPAATGDIPIDTTTTVTHESIKRPLSKLDTTTYSYSCRDDHGADGKLYPYMTEWSNSSDSGVSAQAVPASHTEHGLNVMFTNWDLFGPAEKSFGIRQECSAELNTSDWQLRLERGRPTDTANRIVLSGRVVPSNPLRSTVSKDVRLWVEYGPARGEYPRQGLEIALNDLDYRQEKPFEYNWWYPWGQDGVEEPWRPSTVHFRMAMDDGRGTVYSGADQVAVSGVGTPRGDHSYRLISVATGHAMEAPEDSNPDSPLQQGTAKEDTGDSGYRRQQWTLRPVAGGEAYQLVNVANGLCADVRGAMTADGSEVLQWTCKADGQDSGNQTWRIKDLMAGGRFKLVPEHAPDKVLTVRDGSTADGARLTIAPDAGASHQRWAFQS